MESQREPREIWDEIVRAGKLIRGYEPTIERVENKMVEDRLSGDDARALAEIVSDAQILVGLIEELDRRGVAFA